MTKTTKTTRENATPQIAAHVLQKMLVCGLAIAILWASTASTCQVPLPFERPSIVPSNGPTAGGTQVTIIGSNFSASSAVLFGDQAAAEFTIINENVIQATTPAHAAGVVDVVILDDDNEIQLFPEAFTFEEPAADSLVDYVGRIAKRARRRRFDRHD